MAVRAAEPDGVDRRGGACASDVGPVRGRGDHGGVLCGLPTVLGRPPVGASGARDDADGDTPGVGDAHWLDGGRDPACAGGGGGGFGGGSGGGIGNLGIAGISALLGKMAYDSAKDRMGGLAATPAVTMDSLGRYSLSKALGTGGTREEFGLPAAQESLKFNMGGPVQYFSQGVWRPEATSAVSSSSGVDAGVGYL